MSSCILRIRISLIHTHAHSKKGHTGCVLHLHHLPLATDNTKRALKIDKKKKETSASSVSPSPSSASSTATQGKMTRVRDSLLLQLRQQQYQLPSTAPSLCLPASRLSDYEIKISVIISVIRSAGTDVFQECVPGVCVCAGCAGWCVVTVYLIPYTPHTPHDPSKNDPHIEFPVFLNQNQN